MTVNNVVPLRTRRDSIDTAEAFHADIARTELAEHRYCTVCGKSRLVTVIGPDGVCTRCEPSRRDGIAARLLFSRSRFRRARIQDFLAVLLLLATTALLGCAVVMLSTGQARADQSTATAYGWEMGGNICLAIDDHDSEPGLVLVAADIVEHTGMSYGDAGTAIYTAVSQVCPRHMPMLLRFVARNVHRTPIAGIA